MSIFGEGEFKGRAVITIKRNDDDKYPFTFGLAKAKLIVDHFEEIREWVAKKDPAYEVVAEPAEPPEE
jgi:hypothetical protein